MSNRRQSLLDVAGEVVWEKPQTSLGRRETRQVRFRDPVESDTRNKEIRVIHTWELPVAEAFLITKPTLDYEVGSVVINNPVSQYLTEQANGESVIIEVACPSANLKVVYPIINKVET
jgi:hypothetical protein